MNIEKLQFNNQKSVKNNDQIENKENKKTLEFETDKGDKVSLEYSSYHFEYPEYIKKETGILGYERFTISNEQMNKCDEQVNKHSDDNYLLKEERGLISKQILFQLSNGRFPSESYNYQINYSATRKWDANTSPSPNVKNFKDDKFILQNIFGIDTYRKSESAGTFIPAGGFHPNANPDVSIFDVFDKKSKKMIGCSEVKTTFDNYIDKVDNNEIIIISSNGLNVASQSLYGNNDIFVKNKITFGFDRQDSLFQDYLNMSIELLKEINNINTKKRSWGKPIKPYPDAIFLDILFMINSKRSDFKYAGYPLIFSDLIKHKGTTALEFVDKDIKDRDQFITELVKKTRGDLFNNNDIKSFKTIRDEENRREQSFSVRHGEECNWPSDNPELRSPHHVMDYYSVDLLTSHIPVFINCDEIKQLKWGHASYAAFWTEKGFNFLKIKHAEEFPGDPFEKAKRKVKKFINDRVNQELQKLENIE